MPLQFFGAMAHYTADNFGHRLAVNKSVPILYPKLRQKYGDVVVYDENPAAHLKTEFGFDVLQVAKGHYAPDDYRDHIGFQVADDLLRRAFEETYCLKLDAIFTSYDLAIGTYREAVGSIIPKMTKVAWQTKKDEIMQSDPSMTRNRFLYHLSRSSYRKQWGAKYQQPTLGERILAFFIRILPKIGPLRALSFRMPTPDTEKLFMASFNDAITEYQRLDKNIGVSRARGTRERQFRYRNHHAPRRIPLGGQNLRRSGGPPGEGSLCPSESRAPSRHSGVFQRQKRTSRGQEKQKKQWERDRPRG